MSAVNRALAAIDWVAVATSLHTTGFAHIRGFLDHSTWSQLIAQYDDAHT